VKILRRIPLYPDAGLLVLRLWAGVSLLVFFGIPKLGDAAHFTFAGGPWSFIAFNQKIGLPAPVLVAYLETLNESLGALLLALGLIARPAAAIVAFGFAVATACSLMAREEAWLIAAFYCIAAATVALAGPGRFSIDAGLERSKAKRTLYSE
jgi:putative oxidoreductase